MLRASQVHILTAKEEQKTGSTDLPPTEVAKYLARHGIEVDIVEFPRAVRQSIAEPLLDASIARRASYMVMGAYGHSRFRELVFGGVAREMLSSSKIPFLLSH